MKTVIFKNLRTASAFFIKMVFSIIAVFIIIRFFEYSYIQLNSNQNIPFKLLFQRSINYDFLFVVIASSLLFIPYLLIALLNQKISQLLILSYGFLLILSNIALTQFFLTNNTLLTAVILEFSPSNIIDIIWSELVVDKILMWLFWLLILAASFYLFTRLLKKIQPSKKWSWVLFSLYAIITIASLFNFDHTFKTLKHFDNNYQFLVGNSKHVYLLKSFQTKLNNTKIDAKTLANAIQNYQQETSYFNYTQSELPLIHKTNNNNVLGSYFKQSDNAPNIVFIISESLSSSFSGIALGLNKSITPFVDSLSNNGLYWSNFFSNADRSFGCLPNIFGSLPPGIGERGFINMENEYPSMKYYPNHLNLIQLLNSNGYQTNFFYGGWGNFDNTGRYLKEMGIDHFISDENFDQTKYKKDNDSWGYNDKDLFAQSFDMMNSNTSTQPFLNIYQTISVHTPFNLSEDEYYTEEYLSNKLKKLNLTKADVHKIPTEVLSSIFFADDALSYCIKQYQKRNDFKNTIFIITGDHSIDLNLTEHAFENFHIPLIIYSPLLSKTRSFQGACSHIDIMPSLAILLQEKYGLSFPKTNHWIGQGLDTTTHFQFNRMIPLKMESMDMPNFIYNNNVLYGGNVAQIDTNLSLTDETNIKKQETIKTLYNNFKYINQYVSQQDKIWK